MDDEEQTPAVVAFGIALDNARDAVRRMYAEGGASERLCRAMLDAVNQAYGVMWPWPDGFYERQEGAGAL